LQLTYKSQQSTSISVNHFSCRRNELSLTVFSLLEINVTRRIFCQQAHVISRQNLAVYCINSCLLVKLYTQIVLVRLLHLLFILAAKLRPHNNNHKLKPNPIHSLVLYLKLRSGVTA